MAKIAKDIPDGDPVEPPRHVIEASPRDDDTRIAMRHRGKQTPRRGAHPSLSGRRRNRRERSVVVEREQEVGRREVLEHVTTAPRKNIDHSCHTDMSSHLLTE